jgi:3-hydroxyisobutyrate dehydrogenase-like beta-hydroxyacid dehydrogenase
MTKEKIGFIGVGLMGHGMAGNLANKGWPLTVMAHRSRDAVEDLKSRGASEAATPRELAEQSDIVILCVTDWQRRASPCSLSTARPPTRL